MGIEREIAELDRRVSDCESNISTHNSELDTLKGNQTDLGNDVIETNRELETLAGRNDVQDGKIQTLEDGVGAVRSKTNVMREDIKELQENTLSNAGFNINAPINCNALGISNPNLNDARGVNLYGRAQEMAPLYGAYVGATVTYGKHGKVQGDIATYFTMQGATDRGWIFRIGNKNVASISGNGDIRLDGGFLANTDVRGYSDERLKKNMQTIKDGLAKVMELNGYTFYRKGQGPVKQTGVSAQELQRVLPEAVVADEDGYLTVAYGNVVGLLIEAIKDQQHNIDALDDLIHNR